MNRSLAPVAIVLTTLLINACSEGSSSASTNNGNPQTTQSGQFIDGPVKGASYLRNSLPELFTTSTDGGFTFLAGERIEFRLGNISFGFIESDANTKFVTPRILTLGNDGARINMARFLITLDSDQNPNNGIEISAAVKQAAQQYSGSSDFSAFEDSGLAEFARIANGSARRSLVSSDAAENHLAQSEADISDGQYDYDYNDGGTETDSDNDGVNNPQDQCPNSEPGAIVGSNGCTVPNGNNDEDNDGITNANDNCPAITNSDQANLDQDQRGDACDNDIDGDGLPNDNDSDPRNADIDSDGVKDGADNCPNKANPNQTDTDSDGQGDSCDNDIDNDGIANEADAFPFDPSENTDTDHDGTGDNSDSDRDNDGVLNDDDAFPLDPTESSDNDQDGIGNNADDDDDNDGTPDSQDAFPLDASENTDTDNDGVGDNNDPDIDNDGALNNDDTFPLDPAESSDNDQDGIGNNADDDDDNDGTPDSQDAFPLDASENTDTDNDGVGNNNDPDDDNDGTLDSDDAFPLNANENTDTDGDGIGNNADNDDDNDGTHDSEDAFPLDSTESSDNDQDGIGNNADDDDDNDGTLDGDDAFPLNANENTDTDGDGIGNNADNDDDNDGTPDSEDAFPLDKNESSDSDTDGVGDNTDTCPNTASDQPSNDEGCSATQIHHASCRDGFNLEGNRSYQVVLPITDTNDTAQRISFQVMEPATFDCDNIAKGAHPLMMHGPGYSGSRSTSGFNNFRNDGYTVISWDPRGFGDTSGSVKGMDPEYEGRYLLAIVDWVEQNLDYLAWRNESSKAFVNRPLDGISIAGGDNLLMGSQGGSYGGGYQLLLLSVDPKKRLDAIAPDITWHDLRDALNPGDVVKTVWGAGLAALGTATGSPSLLTEESFAELQNGENILLDDSQDPYIQETVVRSVATNEWPRESLDWFAYRGGLGAWCKASNLPTLPYPSYGSDTIPMIDASNSENTPDKQENGRLGYGNYLVQPQNASQYFDGLEVLLTQGMIDTLFHFNQAWWNYQCLSAAGAKVSLYTHNSGHVIPYGQSPDKPSTDTGGCGFYTSNEQKAWFDARLNPLHASATELPANTPTDTCFALGTEGDTVNLNIADVLAPGASNKFTHRSIVPETPVPNGISGAFNLSANLPVIAPLGKIQGTNGAILAGIPHLKVTVSSLGGINEAAQDCNAPQTPTRTGCDSITFVGLGKKVPIGGSNSPNYTLIDDQLQPIRGLGEHDVDLVGIAERLNEGDEVAVLFYAVHPQYASSASRDVTIPAVEISGTVALPLYISNSDGQAIVGADTSTALSNSVPILAGCYNDARSEDCILAPLAGLLSAPKQQVCLNGGLSSADCPLSAIINPLAANDPSGSMAALAQLAADTSSCLVNADLPLCQLAASDCEADPTGTACGALAVLDVVTNLSDSLGLPVSGKEAGPSYCDLPAGDPDPISEAQEWQRRDLMNVMCSLQRLTDMALHPAFAVALAEGTARTFTYNLIEQLADPTRPRGTLAQWTPAGRTTDPYRIEQDWEDAGRGRVDYISFVAESGSRLVGRVFRPPANVPGPYPSIVITTGSIQGYQEMYNWAGEGLAEAGYLVLMYDVQGQGRSETLPHTPDGNYACDSNGCDGVPFQDSYNFFQGARDAHRWLLSSENAPYINDTGNSAGSNLFNPFASDVDRSRIGHAGHSLGASAISVVGQELACDPQTPRAERDGCISAIVGWDALSSVSDPNTLPIKVPGLSLTAEYFFNPTPASTDSPPNPETKLDAYKQMVAANVDSMRVALRSSTHLEWTYVPLILPASRYGERVSMYYTLGWFDRYVRDDVSAVDRLKSYYFDDSSDLSSIGAGTFNPLFGANAPYKIAGDCAANRLSIYHRSAYHLSDPRSESGLQTSENMRGKGCEIDSDGDGSPDIEDAFPNDPNESRDSDGDGIGDNSDPVNDRDYDEDGSLNEDDYCDNTPSNDGDIIRGCSESQRPTLSLVDTSVNEAAASASVEITLSEAQDFDIGFSFNTSDGTAKGYISGPAVAV